MRRLRNTSSNIKDSRFELLKQVKTKRTFLQHKDNHEYDVFGHESLLSSSPCSKEKFKKTSDKQGKLLGDAIASKNSRDFPTSE